MIASTNNDLTYLHANVCQALADPKRIQILYALGDKPYHVNSLAHDLNIPQPTVSRHLRILRQQSLVATERDGVGVIYRLTDPRIIQVLDTLRLLLVEAIARKTAVLNGSQRA
ncbi:MAG: winged helix-turn-helix transcriptional regulator [Chloroflexi bacterium]|nr:winged helix-turn-helix transcriptional regulator [Chloroflexota bacterium]MBK6709479.1 winged helix-turn-helix transcriptional regulator [Chloroflexota bacterium]MBK7178615.1 winged helix-turn-helix transcriptional regulator [Chloroflexota bacterium]MBK7915250.1 winged helix-turn-helix transcriptional regulator [Chloroflexota bacterium]MBK8935563.1 winged helix-turn-helix transcriptional regulator [Chloroflexota bacterium]